MGKVGQNLVNLLKSSLFALAVISLPPASTTASTHTPHVIMPSPPATAPVVNENFIPCDKDLGFIRTDYDTDPSGKGVFLEYKLVNSEDLKPGAVFLILDISPKGEVKAYVNLPGQGAKEVPFEKLKEQYSSVCDLLKSTQGQKS